MECCEVMSVSIIKGRLYAAYYCFGLIAVLHSSGLCAARNERSWQEAPPKHVDLLDDQNTTLVWTFERPTEPVDVQILMSYHIPGKNYEDVIVYETVNTADTNPVQMNIIYVNYKERVQLSYANGTISMLFKELHISDSGELLMDVRTSAWIFNDITSIKVYSAPKWIDNSVNTVNFEEGSSNSLSLERNTKDTPVFTNLTVMFTQNKPNTNQNAKRDNPSPKTVLYVKPHNSSMTHHVYIEPPLFDKLHVSGDPAFISIMFYFLELTEAYVGRYDIILMSNISGAILSRTIDICVKDSSEATEKDLSQGSCSCTDAHSATTSTSTQKEIQKCHHVNHRVIIIILSVIITAMTVPLVLLVVRTKRRSNLSKCKGHQSELKTLQP